VRTAFLVIALALLVAAPARADIFAVAPVVTSGTNGIDVGWLDLSTGASLTLPAGVNTPAIENHPSISTDGKHLAFERVDLAAGTDRILRTDLTTGQTSDLIDAFTALTVHPTSPAISPAGGAVSTGSTGYGIFSWTGPGSFFRNEDFPDSKLVDPTPGAPSTQIGPYAYRRVLPQSNGVSRGQVFVDQVPGAPGPLAINTTSFSAAHPAIANPTMVYDIRGVDSAGKLEQGDIGYCLLFFHNGGPCGEGQGKLPPLVNSGRDETRPAFTPDGRYIGFIRDEANSHERVYVFDTETQTLIDPDGTDLGLVATLDTGNLSLYERPVLRVTNLPDFGTLVVNPASLVPIGLLVQRVVGHHRLLGRRVPTLKPAGRIPLGTFKRGRHVIHWHAHLRPGLYQFTPRALTKSGRIRDLGTPRIFRVR
jgi:WD40-like Beta Propeller Repeat